MADPGDAWVRSPTALWRDTLDGVVLLGPAEPEPVLATGPARDVWALLERRRTVPALATELAARFPDADPTTVAADLDALLEGLAEQGLARRVP